MLPDTIDRVPQNTAEEVNEPRQIPPCDLFGPLVLAVVADRRGPGPDVMTVELKVPVLVEVGREVSGAASRSFVAEDHAGGAHSATLAVASRYRHGWTTWRRGVD